MFIKDKIIFKFIYHWVQSCSIDLYSKPKWKRKLLIFEVHGGKYHRNCWNNITQKMKDRQEKDWWRVLVNKDRVVKTINCDNREQDKGNIYKLCPWQACCLAYLRYKKEDGKSKDLTVSWLDDQTKLHSTY